MSEVLQNKQNEKKKFKKHKLIIKTCTNQYLYVNINNNTIIYNIYKIQIVFKISIFYLLYQVYSNVLIRIVNLMKTNNIKHNKYYNTKYEIVLYNAKRLPQRQVMYLNIYKKEQHTLFVG